jgi:predicted TIM-barrel fold metal-dependent hydrolase
LEVEVLIDAHVGVDRDRFPVERALEALRLVRIESAVIFADAHARDLDAQNDYILRVAREHGLYPFFYIGGNPWTDTRPDSLTIPDNISEYAGIRWHRWVGTGVDREGVYDRHEIDWAISLMESPEFEAVVAAAAHYRLPVILEESLGVTVEFALRCPSLDIIVPHLGARNGGELNILRSLWDTPNVYFDTSLTRVPETTLSRLGSERILFGSGFPEGDPESEVDKIDRLPVAEEVKERIYGDNLQSLLGAHALI